MSKYFKGNLELLKELHAKSTKVVAWYAHPGQVRGPYNRWLEVTKVATEYEKNVASQSDDAAYAAACMNAVPGLVEEIEELKEQLKITKPGKKE